MKYNNIVKGIFISRPNRFIAKVEIEGTEHTVHVKNTGRCKELLIPGAAVYLQHWDNPKRKTAYDLIAVQKGEKLINMDSQAPNKVFYEWAVKQFPGAEIKPEKTYKDSRFDCYINNNGEEMFVEVKGVTLEEKGHCRFPDAPTERGLKHIHSLTDSVNNGYKGIIFFVIQMEETDGFSPNYDTQPAFGEALKQARDAGVQLMAYNCKVTPDSLEILNPVEIIL